jgi:hypothetical protein
VSLDPPSSVVPEVVEDELRIGVASAAVIERSEDTSVPEPDDVDITSLTEVSDVADVFFDPPTARYIAKVAEDEGAGGK